MGRKNRFWYRCNGCRNIRRRTGGGNYRTARSFRRRIEDYVRTPQCPECGSTDWRLWKWKTNRAEKICRCEGRSFPHKRKYTPGCKYGKGLHEEEFRDIVRAQVRRSLDR